MNQQDDVKDGSRSKSAVRSRLVPLAPRHGLFGGAWSLQADERWIKMMKKRAAKKERSP